MTRSMFSAMLAAAALVASFWNAGVVQAEEGQYLILAKNNGFSEGFEAAVQAAGGVVDFKLSEIGVAAARSVARMIVYSGIGSTSTAGVRSAAGWAPTPRSEASPAALRQGGRDSCEPRARQHFLIQRDQGQLLAGSDPHVKRVRRAKACHAENSLRSPNGTRADCDGPALAKMPFEEPCNPRGF